MAKFIAYEWDDQSVRAIAASAKGSDIAIHQLVEEQIQPPSNELDYETSLDNAIARALEQAGASRGQALTYSARRSQAEVRMLAFPNIPESELPDMVRIQAPTVFNAGDEGLLDFTLLGTLQDGQRYIAAAALSNETQIDVISTAATAGYTIGNMTLHPFGSAHYVEKHLPSTVARLIVDLLGVEAELTVARDGVAHLVRTIRLVPDSPDLNYIASEVRRTLTSYENQPNGGDVSQIVIAGNTTTHTELSRILDPLVSEPIEIFNPFDHARLDAGLQSDLPDNAASFLGLIGAAAQLTSDTIPAIDFLHPTRPPKQTDTRDKAVKYGSLAAVGIAVLIGLALWPIITIKKEISAKQDEMSNSKQVQAQKEMNDSTLGAVNAFTDSRVSWLSEVAYLSDNLPADPNDAIINTFSGRSVAQREGSENGTAAQIFLDMHLKNSGVFALLNGLTNELHSVEGKGLTPDPTEDGLYTRRTQQSILILKPAKPEKADQDTSSEEDDAIDDVNSRDAEDLNSTDADMNLKTTQATFTASDKE